MDESKTVEAKIIKFSPSAARKTLVSRTVKLFHKFEGGHPERGRKMRGSGNTLRFSANKSQKRCEIWPRLLLVTNRKSYKAFDCHAEH